MQNEKILQFKSIMKLNEMFSIICEYLCSFLDGFFSILHLCCIKEISN